MGGVSYIQVNYQEEKRPSFRSDRTQFTVILPNLNYSVRQGVTQDVRQGVTQDVPQGVTQGVPQGVPQGDIDTKILDLIRGNNKLTAEAIAQELSVSSKTVKRHIEKMPNVRYVGSGYSGHWEIVED